MFCEIYRFPAQAPATLQPENRRCRSHSRFILPALLAVLALLVARAAAQTSDFTIVVVPDTDIAAQSYPQTILAQTQWIVNNAAALNIQMVLGEGDNVESPTTTQYQSVDTAIKLLDNAGIPYLLAIGNHDYDNNAPAGRTAAMFNSFFGPSRYTNYPWYGGQFPSGSNENFYGTLTVNGKELLFLMLEFYPRDSAVAWARSVIAAHPNDDVVVVTHAYEYYDGTRAGGCATAGPTYYSLTNVHDGEKLWDNFVKQYGNINLVLNGHFINGDSTGEAVGRRVDPSITGNLVNQVLANYERVGNGGNGYLRIMKFHPSSNTIDVSTYSPTLNTYLTDSNNQFTLTWHGTASNSAGTVKISGSVRDASCNVVSGATVSAGGVSTTTSSSGSYSLSVAVPATVTVSTATGAGWASRTDTAALNYAASTKLQLTNGTGKISGTVTGNGVPAPGAIVSYMGASTLADANGNYQLQDVAAGTWEVTAVATGGPPVTQPVTVSPGATTVSNFALTQSTTGTISGTVKNSSGTAISGTTVSYSGGSTTTDLSGSYTLNAVAAGTYTVTASSPSFISSSQSVTVTAGNTATANFTLAQGSVTVSSPNTAVNWAIGTIQKITWSDNLGSSAVFNIDLSTDGGTTWSSIATGVKNSTSTSGSYTWTVSGPATTQARIRVTWLGPPVTSGMSAVNFTMANPTVTVTYPTATGVNWGVGSTQTIRWTHNLGPGQSMKVELSRDSGSTWATLAAAVANSGSTSGSYNWTVTGPVTSGATALIRVSWTGGTASDVSDNPFTIANPFITVTAPTSSSRWGYGTTQKISWKSNLGALDKVNVLLSADGGVTFPNTLGSNITATTGSLTTTIPTLSAATSTAVMQVQWVSNTAVSGKSPNFAVAAPFITVTKPNGGETWATGTSASITWSNNLGSLESVKIELSTDGGATYPITIMSSTSSTGSKTITVPSGWTTTSGRVRITWLKNTAVNDASDNNFIIQ